MIVAPDSTDVIVYMKLIDPAAGTPETGLVIANLTGGYVRDQAAIVTNALAALGAVNAAHTDWGAIEVDAVNVPGLYRIDFPDAAFVSGVDRVQLTVTGAAIDPAVLEVDLATLAGFPAGAIPFTYTVTDSVTLLPIEGVEVWISTDAGGANIVWKGDTDAFGVARDVSGNLPALDPGTYYFWRQRAGYTFAPEPDTEVVS